VLGVRDYVLKNGFSSVVIGISGGIDSALVSAIACDALGNGNVKGVFMPSSYSSEESREDSRLLSQALGFQLLEIPIDAVNGQYLELLGPIFAGRGEDVTEQNIQARIRGNILMAYSNKFGNLVLATGNKSEMAAGYATLYGDMAGGFAVIKDVSKTMVYRLARYRNGIAPAIPGRILTKAPSAELKENQKDTDTLPPYDVMDPILRGLIEEDRDLEDIVDGGFDEETVNRVARMVQASEYKRRQAPPGIKITARAFGRDRRVPITNRFGNE
jgi:NAD+ synthase (glutamine-hydrolysing)